MTERYDAFREMLPLRDAMNRLFEQSLVRPTGLLSPAAALRMDIYTEGDNYVIEAALPGLSPETVNVSVLGNQVTISGEYPARPEGRQYLLREQPRGRFERTVALPTELEADQAQAHYEHGLLRLTVPKAAAADRHQQWGGPAPGPPASRRDPRVATLSSQRPRSRPANRLEGVAGAASAPRASRLVAPRERSLIRPACWWSSRRRSLRPSSCSPESHAACIGPRERTFIEAVEHERSCP